MKTYLAYWCSDGLEYVADITKYSPEEWAKQELLDILKGDKKQINPLNTMIWCMEIRGQSNPQRYYELYAFQSDVTVKDIEDSFLDSPQQMADLIRRIGTKVFSFRSSYREPKIL